MGSFCPKTILLNFPTDSFHLDKAYENRTVKMYCVNNCHQQKLLSMKPLLWTMVKTYDEAEFNQCLRMIRSLCPVFYSTYF